MFEAAGNVTPNAALDFNMRHLAEARMIHNASLAMLYNFRCHIQAQCELGISKGH